MSDPRFEVVDVIIHANHWIDNRIAYTVTCNPAKLPENDAANDKEWQPCTRD